jgi:hypothetical protein
MEEHGIVVNGYTVFLLLSPQDVFLTFPRQSEHRVPTKYRYVEFGVLGFISM